jgi:Leucine-rich repeat (LRR) protein
MPHRTLATLGFIFLVIPGARSAEPERKKYAQIDDRTAEAYVKLGASIAGLEELGAGYWWGNDWENEYQLPIISISIEDFSKAKLPPIDVPFAFELDTNRKRDAWKIADTDRAMKKLAEFKTLSMLFVHTDVGDAGLTELIPLENIVVLRVSSEVVTDREAVTIGKLKQLNRLILTHTKITDAGLKSLDGLDNLQRLVLPKGVTGTGLKELKSLKNLRSLSAMKNQFHAEGLKSLCQLDQLTEFHFNGTGPTDAGLKELAVMKNLKVLDLITNDLTDAGLKHVGQLTGLESLTYWGAKVTDTGLKEIAGLKNLKYLNLSFANITDDGLKHLHGLANLADLDLVATPVTGATLDGFAGLTRIDLLNTKVTDAGMRGISRLEKLESLNLQGTKITDAGLKELKGMKRLTELSLPKNVSAEGLKEITHLTTIKYLDLYEAALTDAAMKEVGQLTNLMTLDVAGKKTFTDAGLGHLKSLKELRKLNLVANLSDDGLKGFENFPHLKVLSLDCPNITDCGIGHLKELKKLRDLSLRTTKVSDSWEAEFRAALPACKIYLGNLSD